MTDFNVRSRVVLGLMVGALGTAGCGKTEADGDGAGSGGYEGIGEECIAELVAPEDGVFPVAGPEGASAPEPAGGELVDGTYDLASWVAFAFDPADDEDGVDESRETLRVREGGTLLDVALFLGGGVQARTEAIHPIEPGAKTFETHAVCPTVDAAFLQTYSYTATVDKIEIFSDQGTTVVTYERRN